MSQFSYKNTYYEASDQPEEKIYVYIEKNVWLNIDPLMVKANSLYKLYNWGENIWLFYNPKFILDHSINIEQYFNELIIIYKYLHIKIHSVYLGKTRIKKVFFFKGRTTKGVGTLTT